MARALRPRPTSPSSSRNSAICRSTCLARFWRFMPTRLATWRWARTFCASGSVTRTGTTRFRGGSSCSSSRTRARLRRGWPLRARATSASTRGCGSSSKACLSAWWRRCSRPASTSTTLGSPMSTRPSRWARATWATTSTHATRRSTTTTCKTCPAGAADTPWPWAPFLPTWGRHATTSGRCTCMRRRRRTCTNSSPICGSVPA
mmetsp:Transcript_126973/g.367553  ORF Transcript_126973/g.367553 Transcript_126973/m.367553 type:complete len:204 (+) Transcript_126973:992-1603(+)